MPVELTHFVYGLIQFTVTPRTLSTAKRTPRHRHPLRYRPRSL